MMHEEDYDDEISDEELEQRATDVKNTTILIATTLQQAEMPFGVCLAALSMVMTEIAIELEVDRETLLHSLAMTAEVLYNNHEMDKLTGGDYVQ
jgi:hypothetical protein